ncbi:MAG: hypothetical protein ACTSX9_06270 [Candidatus Njordarchaeales archaeon]
MAKELLEEVQIALKIPEEVQKVLTATPEELVDKDLRQLSRELSKKFHELREISRKLIEKRRELISILRDERAKRNELNEKVREVAQAIRQLRERRRELQKFINEKRNEGNQIREKIKELSKQVESIEREIKGFNRRELQRLQAQIERLEWALQTQTLPDIIEKRITERILRLSEKLKILKQQEEQWKQLQKLRQELEKYKSDLTAIRRSLAIYYEERRRIDEKIAELAKIRDEKKSEADQHHAKVQEIREEIAKINDALAKIRDIRQKIMLTLRRISKLREEKEELRRKEELKKLIQRRLQEIRAKIMEEGKLDYRDLEFLVEHGLLTDEFLEQFLQMSEEEQAEVLLEGLEGELEEREEMDEEVT